MEKLILWLKTRSSGAIVNCVAVLFVFWLAYVMGRYNSQNYGQWNFALSASSHATTLGLMSAFLATVIVIVLLLMEARLIPNPQGAATVSLPSDAPLAGRAASEHPALYHSLAILITAFFHCAFAAFLFASAAGYPRFRNTSGQTEVLYQYLFNVISVEYFLSIYLTFFGVTTLANALSVRPIRRLTNKIMDMLFWLGSFLIFSRFWSTWVANETPQHTIWWNWFLPAAIFGSFKLCVDNPAGRSHNRPFHLLERGLAISLLIGAGVAAIAGFALAYSPDDFIKPINWWIFYRRYGLWLHTTTIGCAVALGWFFMRISAYRAASGKPDSTYEPIAYAYANAPATNAEHLKDAEDVTETKLTPYAERATGEPVIAANDSALREDFMFTFNTAEEDLTKEDSAADEFSDNDAREPRQHSVQPRREEYSN